MAGRTFSDRMVARGNRVPVLPPLFGVPGRKLLLMLAAVAAAFGIAYAAGAALVSKPASGAAALVPSTRSAESRLRILAVDPAPAAPELKLPPPNPVVRPRPVAHPAPATAVSINRSTPGAAAIPPVTAPRISGPTTPSAPAVAAPVQTGPAPPVPQTSSPAGGGTSGGGSSSSHGGSGGGGTGTSSGGDNGSGGGTGTVTGGG